MPPTALPPAAARTPSSAQDKKAERVATRRIEEEDIRPYVLTSELGKGSFAIVYKGYNENTKEHVAIKTVSRSGLSSKLFDNLQSEIDILKSLSHRHITKLIDIVRSEKNIYLIMEYCSGGDLTNYIKKRGKVDTLEYVPSPGAAPIYYPHPKAGGLDEIVVRSFLRQLGRALKFLRSRNLIHRDIKPQNLLLKPASPEELARGHPLGVPILKVADFGFARMLPNAMMAETLCGSPLYMAPEILRYEKYDAKADLWSLGAVLYEMTTGRPPFRAQNHIDLLKKIEHSKAIRFPDEDQPEGERDPELKPIPQDIKGLIRSLLKRFPAQRASYDEFFNSTALAKSKFPRPMKDKDVVPLSARASSSGHGDAETVVIGTVTKRPKLAVLQDAPIPENDRIAPPLPGGDAAVKDLKEGRLVTQTRLSFRKKENVSPVLPIPDAFSNGHRSGSPPFGTAADPVQAEPVRKLALEVRTKGKPLSTEASIIPGESEEDGILRREYVMVGDNQAIEFGKKVDEITAARRRSSAGGSPTTEKRHSQVFRQSSDGGSPVAGPAANTAFPPPPNPNAPPLSASPSRGSALTRAISIASKKLFGSSTPGSGRSPSVYPYNPERNVERAYNEKQQSPMRVPLILGGANGTMRDPLEEELLAGLEELAQKTDVLTRWADEMYEYVKAVPQKPLPLSSKFERLDGETESATERRRTSMIDAEYNAVACIALYLLLMSFSQRGIDRLRVHQEGMKMRDPEGRLEVSEGFDDALNWFSTHFVKCSDRVALVRTWLPETAMEGPSWLGQLVYDRALQLSRKAAHMELVEQGTPSECAALYDESLWCLYALQDDLMQAGNPFQEEDKVTIETWIEKTKKRLASCRNKLQLQQAMEGKKVGNDETKSSNSPARGVTPRGTPPWENRASPLR
ncbi:kinase-like protein [Fomitiporia mediterranea MF3/22]|uniref:kinase-like protein n=1 Tax=Fomitiporia mediterranea (strain MF3/22) TaxID=694068 RepID=UPI0004408668|nr:kinase-like protein [Fomitiporia mediterranea MF3/22]EJD01812.1 kinase-like protein [Fomitiporia mediterranea MF3/22]